MDEQLGRHAGNDACQHQIKGEIGQIRTPQFGVLETREALVGKAHDKQADPAEDHGMRVGMDGLHQVQLQEALAQRDLRQVHRSPKRSHREHDGDARLEEAPVNKVFQGFLVHVAFLRMLRFGVQLIQKCRQVDLMDRGKE